MTANPKPRAEFDAGHVPITEEMDSLRRTLPPVIPIVVALVIVGGLLAAYLLTAGSRPTFSGSITKVDLVPVHIESAPALGGGGIRELTSDVEQQDQVVLLTQVHVSNPKEARTLFVKNISAAISTDHGDVADDAAPAGDYVRIFQAYPALAPDRGKPIMPETKLLPGEELAGTEIFSFQMPIADFQKRKSMTVTVNFYDRDPLVLTVRPTQVEELTISTEHESATMPVIPRELQEKK